jgi:hypothetical protein
VFNSLNIYYLSTASDPSSLLKPVPDSRITCEWGKMKISHVLKSWMFSLESLRLLMLENWREN